MNGVIPLRELPSGAGRPWSRQKLYRPFVYAALAVALTLGFTTGAGMLFLTLFGPPDALMWKTHIQAHGAAQLMGWAGLFVMGVGYHVIPRFRNVAMTFLWPQRVSLGLMVAGILLRFFGQGLHAYWVSPFLMAGSGVTMLAGVLVFATVTGHTLRRGPARRGITELWIWAGISWAVAAACLHAAIMFDMAGRGAAVATPWLNDLFIQTAAVGFLGSFIFGVGTRTLGNFAYLKPTRARMGYVAFALFNAGVAWETVAGFSRSVGDQPVIGGLLVALGVVAYVLSLRLLEPGRARKDRAPLEYRHVGLFVRAAFVWLLVWAAFDVGRPVAEILGSNFLRTAVAEPVLHVYALGFVSMMIVGMASRLLAAFEGGRQPGHRLLDAAFVLINGSVAVRLVAGIVRLENGEPILAVSGVMGLAAIVLFAWTVWRVFGPAAHSVRQEVQLVSRARMESARTLQVRQTKTPSGGE